MAEKPSDLSPLFSDEKATPEEIARARKIVAYVELKELVALYRRLVWLEAKQWAIDDTRKKITDVVLELFPED
jgi:hypothetical protein